MYKLLPVILLALTIARPIVAQSRVQPLPPNGERSAASTLALLPESPHAKPILQKLQHPQETRRTPQRTQPTLPHTHSRPTHALAAAARTDSALTYSFYSSTDSVLSSKEIFAYDARGYLILDEFYNWDPYSEVWVAYYKYEYDYDDWGRLTLDAYYTGSGYDDQWIGYTRYEYTYTALGQTATETYSYWDGTAWAPNYRYDYTYNDAGQLTLLEYSFWDSYDSEWLDYAYYRWEYTTNALGQDTLETIYYSDYYSETPYSQYAYAYNDRGLVSVMTYASWDYFAGWMPQSKEEYAYNEAGALTLIVASLFDTMTSKWYYYYKDEITYDAWGYLTSWADYSWYTTTGEWIGQWKYEWVNAPTGQLLVQTFYYGWDYATTSFVPYSREVYTYQADGQIASYMVYAALSTDTPTTAHLPASPSSPVLRATSAADYQWVEQERYEYLYNPLGNLLYINYYYWDGYQWFLYSRTRYYYGTPTAAPSLLAADTWRLYPNPTRGQVSLTLPTGTHEARVRLFTLTGMLMQETTLQAHESQLLLHTVPAGIYLLELQTPQGRATRKLVVE
ncbi:Por secretion system C-terminal sorting domain-containing protein [Catalinimonas alkaloidigena]|uniref:Por secretion system C-terminal sorting domain-containing protein n=1 Tax=Catalinimonas alkaloidigena TaxID=1075417 RepID=A0A1G9T1C6_9BACT|nr:T9SS type A sorting domain-containing protein [Catalinimonas alkaloidigena]SDM41450.1 Por secretion system C-terminal sorting domain-containing protein [Catalinimonas alkaloidigena]